MEPIKIRNHKFMNEILKSRIGTPVLNLIHDYFVRSMKHNKHIVFHGRISDNKVITLFLFWMVEYQSEIVLEKLYGYPHSHMNKLIEKIILFLDTFSNEIVKFNSFADRDQYRRTHAHGIPKTPIDLTKATLVIDAKDFLVERKRGDSKHGDQGFWSEKNQAWSMKITFVADLRKDLLFVSEAKPASHHDIYRLREAMPLIEPHLSPDDVIVLDKGYTGVSNDKLIGTWLPKRKHKKNTAFTEEDKLINSNIETIRRPIEDELGEMSRIFSMFLHKYRHDRKWFTSIVRFAAAVTNLVRQHKHDPSHFPTEWTGPIAEIPKHKNSDESFAASKLELDDDSEYSSSSNSSIEEDELDQKVIPQAVPPSPPKRKRGRKMNSKKGKPKKQRTE